MKKKLAGILITIFCIVAFITLFILFGEHEKVITQFSFGETIVVTDGVADVESTEFPVTLEKSGLYTLYTEWNADKYATQEGEDIADAGLISGLVVYSPTGEIVFATTGEGVQAESVEMGLAAGEYIVQYRYLTNDEGLQALIAESDATVYDSSEYTYAENGVFEMEYHFKVKQGDALNWFVAGSLVVGLCIGLVVVMLLMIVTKDDKSLELKYDERQMKERGTAFKLAFFTELVYTGFLCLCYMSGIHLPVAIEVLLFFGIILSMAVYVIYCIWKEAYIALNENVKKVNIAFVIIGIVNIFIGVMHCLTGTMIEDGILTFRCINLLCGVFILIVAIMVGCMEWVKNREND